VTESSSVAKWRVWATVWLFLVALGIGAITAVALQQVVVAWWPFDAGYGGAYVPAYTATIVGQAPRLPWYLGAATAATALSGLGLWRSRWTLEARLWAAAMLAGLLLALSAALLQAVLVGLFVLPKIANAALAA
jgi:hypothetical protein